MDLLYTVLTYLGFAFTVVFLLWRVLPIKGEKGSGNLVFSKSSFFLTLTVIAFAMIIGLNNFDFTGINKGSASKVKISLYENYYYDAPQNIYNLSSLEVKAFYETCFFYYVQIEDIKRGFHQGFLIKTEIEKYKLSLIKARDYHVKFKCKEKGEPNIYEDKPDYKKANPYLKKLRNKNRYTPNNKPSYIPYDEFQRRQKEEKEKEKNEKVKKYEFG